MSERRVISNVAKATQWSGLTELGVKLIAPITNAVLARLLVPAAFGVVATLTMVVSFAEIFTDAGFQKYLVQHEFDDEEDLNRSTNVAFWTNLIFSLVLWGIISLFAEPIATLVGSPGCGKAVIVMSLQIPLLAFSSIQMARYRRDMNFKGLFVARMSTAFVPLIITVPLAMAFKSYWALVVGTLTKDLLNALILTCRSKWKPQFYYSLQRLKDMLSFSAWTLLENITIWLTNYIGTFIVGIALTEYYLGLYKTTMSTVNGCLNIIATASTQVLFAALSRYQEDEEQLQCVFFKFQRMVSLLLIPLGFGLFVYRDLATSILLGKQWTETAFFLGAWSLISSITIVLSNFNSELFRSKGKPKLSVLSQCLHLTLLVPLLILCMDKGFMVLAVARSVSRLQLVLVTMLIAHFSMGIKFWKVLKNVYPSFVAAMVMAAAAFFLQRVSGAMIWQIASVVICVVVYFLVLLILPAGRRQLMEVPVVSGILHKLVEKRNANTSGDGARELENCNFVKTVLMILVVLYHSVLFWKGTWFTADPAWAAPWLGVFAQWLNSFHIFGFTLISGYLFYYLKQERNKYCRFLPFLGNKAKRLLVPYVFVAAVWAAPFQWYFRDLSWAELLKQFVLGTGPAQLWFLLMLFWVFLIVWPLAKKIARYDALSIAVAVGFYLIGTVGAVFAPNVLQIWTACKYVLFFVVGFKLRQHGSKMIRKIPWPVWVVAHVALFALNQYLAGMDSSVIRLLSMGVSLLLNLVGAVMAFVVFQWLADKVPYRSNKVMKFFTKMAMPIYLFHQQIIFILLTLLNGILPAYIHSLVNFVGAIGISAVIAMVMMRFRFTRFLIGEK